MKNIYYRHNERVLYKGKKYYISAITKPPLTPEPYYLLRGKHVWIAQSALEKIYPPAEHDFKSIMG